MRDANAKIGSQLVISQRNRTVIQWLKHIVHVMKNSLACHFDCYFSTSLWSSWNKRWCSNNPINTQHYSQIRYNYFVSSRNRVKLTFNKWRKITIYKEWFEAKLIFRYRALTDRYRTETKLCLCVCKKNDETKLHLKWNMYVLYSLSYIY